MDGSAANMAVPMLKTQPFTYQPQTGAPAGHLPPGAHAITTVSSSNYNNACILNNLAKYYQTSAPSISSAAAAANAANAAAYAAQTQPPLMAPSAMMPAQGGQAQPLQTAIMAAQTPPAGKEQTTGSQRGICRAGRRSICNLMKLA